MDYLKSDQGKRDLNLLGPDRVFKDRLPLYEDKGSKGLFGIGARDAQEPPTREEFDEFIQSGGIAQVANGGMMGGVASLNNPEYQRLMSASNFGF